VSSDLILMTACGAFFGGAVLIFFRAWEQSRLNEARWKLFSLRDDLCFLAATDVVDESSDVYRLLMDQLHVVVVNAEHFTPASFARAVLAADRQALAGRREREAFFSAVKQAPVEMQRAVERFYRTVAEVMLANSVWLSVLLYVRRRMHRLWTALGPVRAALRSHASGGTLQAYTLAEKRATAIQEAQAQSATLSLATR